LAAVGVMLIFSNKLQHANFCRSSKPKTLSWHVGDTGFGPIATVGMLLLILIEHTMHGMGVYDMAVHVMGVYSLCFSSVDVHGVCMNKTRISLAVKNSYLMSV
jgi:hypothetical protein